MSRDLTENETAVLSHVVLDPTAWWEHANSPNVKPDAESSLAAKVAAHQSAYDTDLADKGDSYQTRAEIGR